MTADTLKVVARAMAFACTLGAAQAGAEVISWAGQVDPNTGFYPRATGAPDATSVIGRGPFTAKQFDVRRTYTGLAGFLGVPASLLERADVIAWEGNGGAPAPSGGWESARFLFTDGTDSVTVDWVETVGAPVPAAVLKTGTVTFANFTSFFGIAPGTGEPGLYSYLLFDLPPEIDTASPGFAATLTLGVFAGLAGEGSPDTESIGVFSRSVPEPSTLALALAAFGAMRIASRRRARADGRTARGS